MDLALNNLQRLTWHKTQLTNQQMRDPPYQFTISISITGTHQHKEDFWMITTQFP